MNLKFALLAGISVSTAGIIGIVGYFFSRAKDLKDILNGEGKKPLDLTDTKDDADWDKLIAKYLGSNSLGKVTKIEGVDIKQDSKDNKQNLKNKCKELLKTPISSDDTFNKIKTTTINWCTKSSELLITNV